MIDFIKRFFCLMTAVSTKRLERSRLNLDVFDLVSMVPNPKPQDVYVVYSFSGEDVYFLKWDKYCSGGVFDANINKQLCFPYKQASDNFYKMKEYGVKPSVVLMNCSITELRTFVKRFQDAFYENIPLLGMFVDNQDDHVMLITDVRGSVESGVATVYDLTVAPSAGITYFKQIAHVVRLKDIIGRYELRPIDVSDMVLLLKRQWRREVFDDFSNQLFNAIRKAEGSGTNGKHTSIYCNGFAYLNRPVQQQTATQQLNENKKETKNEENR